MDTTNTTARRTYEFGSAAYVEQFVSENAGAVEFVNWIKNSVTVSGELAPNKPVQQKPAARVKMLPDLEVATLMEPLLDGSYRQIWVEKHFFKCLDCGLVWQTETEAEICAKHNHATEHVRFYGGRFENGVHVGGAEHKIPAVRREAPEPAA